MLSEFESQNIYRHEICEMVESILKQKRIGETHLGKTLEIFAAKRLAFFFGDKEKKSCTQLF